MLTLSIQTSCTVSLEMGTLEFFQNSVNSQHYILLVIGLVAQLATVKTQMSCITQDYYLPSNQQVFNITSPNYPGAYRPGTNCRFRIIAPYAHVVVLNCIFEVVSMY